MPDRTVNEITDDAYDLVGNKSPKSEDDTKALRFLQNMLSSWSMQGLIIPYYVTENFTLTIGQAVYTIGVTGDSPDLITSTGRPVKVVSSWIRQSNNDYPIEIMREREYNEILRKDTTQRPTKLYYDPQYPNGTIRFNYESDLAHDFYLVSEKPLAEVTAITDTLNLPLGINEALVFNLAIRLSGGLAAKISDDVRRIALESLSILEKANLSNKINPAKLDNAIIR